MTRASENRSERRRQERERITTVCHEMRRWLFPPQPYEADWYAEIVAMPTVLVYPRNINSSAMRQGDCHTNARLFCDAYPEYEMVRGWIACEGIGRAVAHTVVRHKQTRHHYDVSPMLQDTPDYDFTPDPELVVPYYDAPAPKGSRPGISRRGVPLVFGGLRENPAEFIGRIKRNLRALAA